MKGLEVVGSRVSSDVKDCRKQNYLALSLNRRDVFHDTMQGQPRPTPATEVSIATARNLPEHRHETYDRVPHEVSAIIFMVTQIPASLIVLKHEDATGTIGDKRKAWEED